MLIKKYKKIIAKSLFIDRENLYYVKYKGELVKISKNTFDLYRIRYISPIAL